MHPPPPSSYQPPPSSLPHPQQYSNQNIARNWAIFPNLGRKIQSCPFCLKIGSMVSWRRWSWIQNLDPKSQSCPFCLKIISHGISRMLILIPILVLWISHSKSCFGQTWAKKVKVICFAWKLAHMVSRGCWFLFQYLFSKFQSKNQSLGKFLGFASKLAHMVFRGCGLLFRN